MKYMTNNFDDFEEWEAISEFTENEDWKGLVKWAATGYTKHPNEYFYQYHYGSALIQNGEYKQAIEVLSQAYNIHFESPDIVHSLLDALFLSGKTENDFKWKVQPEILLLNDLTIQACEAFLKGKRKYTSFTDIYCELVISGAYLKFSDDELHDYLIQSGKFDFVPEFPQDIFGRNFNFKNK